MNRYIMKNYKPNLQSDKWEYIIFDEKFNELSTLILNPTDAVSLGYTPISPMDLYRETRK